MTDVEERAAVLAYLRVCKAEMNAKMYHYEAEMRKYAADGPTPQAHLFAEMSRFASAYTYTLTRLDGIIGIIEAGKHYTYLKDDPS